VAASRLQAAPVTNPATAAPPPASKPKLSFKAQRELEELPMRIEALEAQIAGFTAKMAEAGYFQRDAAAVTADNAALAAAQAALDAAYARWEELEGN
jgi:ATP-binding cassette subfamily F protein uup